MTATEGGVDAEDVGIAALDAEGAALDAEGVALGAEGAALADADPAGDGNTDETTGWFAAQARNSAMPEPIHHALRPREITLTKRRYHGSSPGG